jgi:hypothetical protein
MDNSQKDQRELPPHLEQKKLIEFLESLHRIFKIGIYYPTGHKVLDQAAQQFQRNILAVADTNRSVIIELQGKKLIVEGQEILLHTGALREFTKLLLDLGIGTLEIDRAIPLSELLQLVKSLLLGRSQLQGIKEFTQADIADLPRSVRISQKEFMVDGSALFLDDSDEDAEHGLNTVFQVLAEQGLTRDKIEKCKVFLNSLAARFSEKPLSVKNLPKVTWSEVRNLLVKVISNTYQLSGNSVSDFAQNDLNALSAIFHSLGSEFRDKESKETINLLVSIFGSSSPSKKHLEGNKDRAKGIRDADNISVQSAQQLQLFVNKNFLPPEILQQLNEIDRREELAILLQLLQFKQEAVVENNIGQNLRDILSTTLNDREVEILVRGVQDLALKVDNNRFFDILQLLTILSRSAKNFSSQQFLAMICQKIAPLTQANLWPIIVNEALAFGLNVDQKAFTDLIAMASALPGREMKERWPELETMDRFQEKKIATEIFDPDLQNTFPLFAFLLETSLKQEIGARILTSLQRKSPDWLIEAVAPLLQLAIPHHMKFLQIYLSVAQQKYFSDTLRTAAGTLVVQHLPELSEQQRRESWVVKTIQATTELQIAETRSLLERIRDEKHMIIVPKWPSACRHAATAALKRLRRRPLQEGR